MKTSHLVAALLLLAPATASAGGSPGSIGVGGELTLLGIGGASVNYDQGDFHVGGFLGFADDSEPGPDNDETIVQIGGRFYYHIHSTAMSDFGLGGQLGLRHTSFEGPADDDTDFTIDLGAQIRAFITANVALSLTLGFGLYADEGDDDGFALGSQTVGGDLTGGAGLHYYFF